MEFSLTLGLVTILLFLQMQIPSSAPIRRCPADSFFNRATNRCQECTPYCPEDSAIVRDCRDDSDTVCRLRPSSCPSDSFRDPRTGLCRECTKFCRLPSVLVAPCRPNADAVCATAGPEPTRQTRQKQRTKERKVKTVPRLKPPPVHPIGITPSSALIKPGDSPIENSSFQGVSDEFRRSDHHGVKDGTTPAPSQNRHLDSHSQIDRFVTIAKLVNPGFAITTAPTRPGHGDGPPFLNGVHRNPTQPSINDAYLSSTGVNSQQLSVVISVLVIAIVAIVVCVITMTYCWRVKRDVTERNFKKMGEMVASRMQNADGDYGNSPAAAFNLSTNPGIFQDQEPVMDSGPPSPLPGEDCISHCAFSTVSLSPSGHSAAPSCPTTLTGAGDAFRRYGDSSSFGRPSSTTNPSMTNIYPPPPMAAPSLSSVVKLRGSGTETVVDHHMWNPEVNYSQEGSDDNLVTVQYHPLKRNYGSYFMSSTFSLSSIEGSEYTV